jgi:hypothetical protein
MSTPLPVITNDWVTRRTEVQRTITPDIARDFLSKKSPINPNRKSSMAKVNRFAALIQDGKWHDTGEPMKFDINGFFVDGFNRAAAVIVSGCAVKNDVAFGVPEGAFAFMDSGQTRNAKHVFETQGMGVNSARLAKAITWILRYQKLPANGLTKQLGQHDPLIWHDTRMEFLHNNPSVRECLGAELKAAISFPEPVAIAAYFLGAQVNQKRTVQFFAAVESGAYLAQDDPCLVFRETWMKVMQQQVKSKTKLNPAIPMALILKAMRHYFNDDKITTLRWKASNGTPRLSDGFVVEEPEVMSKEETTRRKELLTNLGLI